jgi:hypothetical protein
LLYNAIPGFAVRFNALGAPDWEFNHRASCKAPMMLIFPQHLPHVRDAVTAKRCHGVDKARSAVADQQRQQRLQQIRRS